MIEWISKLFGKPTGPTESIRTASYKDSFNIGDTPMIELVGAKRVDVENLIPFLVSTDEMIFADHAAEKTVAYNGEKVDEIHIFEDLTQNNNRVARIMLHNGDVAEVTLK